MKKYYRCYSESYKGEIGHEYYEVDDQMITRMMWSYNGRLFWATPTDCKDEQFDFTDQPEFLESDKPSLFKDYELVELAESEFEELWRKANE